MIRDLRTFGPAVSTEPDGTLKATCTWCVFRINQSCTYSKPLRDIPDTSDTPDWCAMKADMLRDVRKTEGEAQP